ncbi:Transmembrane protein 40 [Heterocephalus glaber]|uniref:Transmembrane protein 40 n=1 Tax=Heterocephalus glaber TaxID=10181 RepID=G5BYD6_HETGA|nr:Transmembrane protein 40 [Heterocephalus glaber]
METPGTPSQPQDSNLLHREAEGPPYGEMDLRQQDGKAGLLSGEQYKRDKSSSSSSSSSGAEAEHEAPGISKDELQLYRDGPGEVEPSGEARLRQRGVDSTEDWFMSLGVGLLTFASLETVGIYFGLVYRIHSVLRGFPLPEVQATGPGLDQDANKHSLSISKESTTHSFRFLEREDTVGVSLEPSVKPTPCAWEDLSLTLLTLAYPGYCPEAAQGHPSQGSGYISGSSRSQEVLSRTSKNKAVDPAKKAG